MTMTSTLPTDNIENKRAPQDKRLSKFTHMNLDSPKTELNDHLPEISKRVNELRVLSIDEITIINKANLEENKQMNVDGKFINVKGALFNADLQITFSIPYQIDEKVIAANISQSVSLVTNDVFIELFYLSESKGDHIITEEPKKFNLLVPLLRGFPEKKSLLDKFGPSDNHTVHHTVMIP